MHLLSHHRGWRIISFRPAGPASPIKRCWPLQPRWPRSPLRPGHLPLAFRHHGQLLPLPFPLNRWNNRRRREREIVLRDRAQPPSHYKHRRRIDTVSPGVSSTRPSHPRPQRSPLQRLSSGSDYLPRCVRQPGSQTSGSTEPTIRRRRDLAGARPSRLPSLPPSRLDSLASADKRPIPVPIGQTTTQCTHRTFRSLRPRTCPSSALTEPLPSPPSRRLKPTAARCPSCLPPSRTVSPLCRPCRRCDRDTSERTARASGAD